MPLLDYFHAPLKGNRHWESFHGLWAGAMAAALNKDLLPPDYFAEFQVHLGARVEIDVATFEERIPEPVAGPDGTATAMAERVWAPPVPTLEMPAVFPDDIEVQVFSTVGGPNLVAAIELVSPANKDRPEVRTAFATKCAAYLQRGIGLVVVDVVTERQANLHDELVRLLGYAETHAFTSSTPLYAVAYRPARRQEKNLIQMWLETLAVGQSLPLLPLALRGGPSVPLNLEATYTEARERSRLP
jgi:hypothetical protein